MELKFTYFFVNIYKEGMKIIAMYIPTYNQLYNGVMKDQVYVSRLLQENFKRQPFNLMPLGPCELGISPCSAVHTVLDLNVYIL